MQLAPSALPLGPRGVNSVEMAKHVEPIAESWRTGVQIPPAPPNKPLKILGFSGAFSLGVEDSSIFRNAHPLNVIDCPSRKVISADGSSHPDLCGNAVLLGHGEYLDIVHLSVCSAFLRSEADPRSTDKSRPSLLQLLAQQGSCICSAGSQSSLLASPPVETTPADKSDCERAS